MDLVKHKYFIYAVISLYNTVLYIKRLFKYLIYGKSQDRIEGMLNFAECSSLIAKCVKLSYFIVIDLKYKRTARFILKKLLTFDEMFIINKYQSRLRFPNTPD